LQLSKLSQLNHLKKLEQLRFLDHGYNIFVEDYACEPPIGIDTPTDLEKAIMFAKTHD